MKSKNKNTFDKMKKRKLLINKIFDIIVAAVIMIILLAIIVNSAEAEEIFFNSEVSLDHTFEDVGFQSLSGTAFVVYDDVEKTITVEGVVKGDTKYYNLEAFYKDVTPDGEGQDFVGYYNSGSTDSFAYVIDKITGEVTDVGIAFNGANAAMTWYEPGGTIVSWTSQSDIQVFLSEPSDFCAALREEMHLDYINLLNYNQTKIDDAAAWKARSQEKELDAAAWKARFVSSRQESTERINKIHEQNEEIKTLKLAVRALEAYLR